MTRLKYHLTRQEIRDAVRNAEWRKVTLIWVVYHEGARGGWHRAKLRLLAKGFQPTPWRCPKCHKRAMRPTDLRYALASKKRRR